MSSPRPSISPMSNARGSTHPSPTIQRAGRNINVQDEEEDDPVLSYEPNDDKSSSLSEPEDDDEDEGDIENEEDDIVTSRYELQDDEIDSEAETERIDQTPRKLRDVGENGNGRTPSKLAKVEHADDDLSEPPSPLIREIGAASSTSTVAGANKKRKHSDILESPLTSEGSVDGEYPHKRNTELKDETSEGSKSRDETDGAEDGSKSGRGRKKLTRSQLDREATADDVEEEAADVDAEEPAEAQPEEDPVQKSEAMDAFAELAKQFHAFRDALISERIASIDAELALLEQPKCAHPEYLRMVASVDARRTKQNSATRAYHGFRSQATREKTLAERSQMHSQYFQTVREVREQALDTLGSEWHAIQRDRRQGVTSNDDETRAMYRYVNKRGEQLRQQAKYNREVSILSGLAKYVGFPAAPDITGVSGDAMDNDLKAMKLVRHVQTYNAQPPQHNSQRHASHQTTSYMPRPQAVTAASSERSAHDQYIEQHAWARAPQSSNHVTVTTPNISHTPEWAEHASGFRKMAFPNSGRFSPQPSPFGTPREVVHDHRMPEPAPQPMTEQIPEQQPGPRHSPLAVQKQRLNGGVEVTGWRNISGTSTIDAPLDDVHRAQENADAREAAKRELPVHDISSQATTAVLPPEHSRQAHGLTQAEDNPPLFRAAGFRPLDTSYIPAPPVQGPPPQQINGGTH